MDVSTTVQRHASYFLFVLYYKKGFFKFSWCHSYLYSNKKLKFCQLSLYSDRKWGSSNQSARRTCDFIIVINVTSHCFSSINSFDLGESTTRSMELVVFGTSLYNIFKLKILQQEAKYSELRYKGTFIYLV